MVDGCHGSGAPRDRIADGRNAAVRFATTQEDGRQPAVTSRRQRLLAASPAKVFLLLGSTIGIAYLLATPPLLVPDEFRPLRRTVQIAHGGIITGATVPASLERFANTLRDVRRGGRGSLGRAFPVDKLRAAGAVHLEPDDTVYWAPD